MKRQNTKRWISLLLAVLMLGTMGIGFCEEESNAIDFDPMITKILDRTSTTWISTSSNREELVATLLLDLSVSSSTSGTGEEISFEDLLTGLLKCVYVGKKDTILVVTLPYKEQLLTVTYMPLTNFASYFFNDLDSSLSSSAMAEYLIKTVMSSNCDEYYQVDAEAVIENISLIINALVDED